MRKRSSRAQSSTRKANPPPELAAWVEPGIGCDCGVRVVEKYFLKFIVMFAPKVRGQVRGQRWSRANLWDRFGGGNAGRSALSEKGTGKWVGCRHSAALPLSYPRLR